jgi:hypothetical protein
VKHARGECAVNIGEFEHVKEMLHTAGTTGRDQRYLAVRPYRGQLPGIVTLAHPVPVHAIKHYLSGAAIDRFFHPAYGVPLCKGRLLGVTRVLVDVVVAVVIHAVDSQHHTLGAESFRESIDQVGVAERGRIHGDFVGALVQDIFRVGHAADAARNAERYVQEFGDLADPAPVDGAAVRARRDVVEDQFVGALVAVSPGQFDDIADDTVPAETDAFDDGAVANVEAGDYASRRNDEISPPVIRPSSSARPVIADAAPVSRSAARSARFLTPPDACSCSVG